MNTDIEATKPVPTLNDLERVMLEMDQVECPVTHYFGPGLYIREVRMKAGTLVVGHEHNCDQVNTFIAGKLMLLKEDGNHEILNAPMTFIGKPGRKVAYILEDVIWQNVYATNETDMDKIEDLFVTKSDSWQQHNKPLDMNKFDYHQTLRLSGLESLWLG